MTEINDSRLAVCLLRGGDIYEIDAGGRRYRFEMHPRCGPAVVRGRYDSIDPIQPGARSVFWHAVSLWDQQGKRLDEHGLCLWDEESQPITKQVTRGHHVIVGWTTPERGR